MCRSVLSPLLNILHFQLPVTLINRFICLVHRMAVHPIAQLGFSSDSSNYDSVRPDHQLAAVAKLLESLGIPPHGRIVEVGSGTGKFMAHLLNRSEDD